MSLAYHAEILGRSSHLTHPWKQCPRKVPVEERSDGCMIMTTLLRHRVVDVTNSGIVANAMMDQNPYLMRRNVPAVVTVSASIVRLLEAIVGHVHSILESPSLTKFLRLKVSLYLVPAQGTSFR